MRNKQTKIPVKLKQTLKSLRVRAGMNQDQASSLLGISVSKLRRWEEDSSDLSYKEIELVEKVYSLPVDYIFFGTHHAFSEKIKQEA